MVEVKCVLCGSSSAGTVMAYSMPDQYETSAGVTDDKYFRRWVRCSDCGFYYSVYSRAPGALNNLYATEYRRNGAAWRKETSEEIFNRVVALPERESETCARVAWIKSRMDKLWSSGIVERGPKPRRLLDIGGASGVFAYQFQDGQWRSSVVDPSEAGKFLETRHDIEYRQCGYTPGLFKESFDLVSLVFTLEHIPDLFSMLKDLKNDMRENSFLYIEVPDAVSFRLLPEDDDIFNSCHLWMFDPASLVRLLDCCGFHMFSLERTRTIRGHYSLMALGGVKWR